MTCEETAVHSPVIFHNFDFNWRNPFLIVFCSILCYKENNATNVFIASRVTDRLHGWAVLIVTGLRSRVSDLVTSIAPGKKANILSEIS